jgi:hypothetical protein
LGFPGCVPSSPASAGCGLGEGVLGGSGSLILTRSSGSGQSVHSSGSCPVTVAVAVDSYIDAGLSGTPGTIGVLGTSGKPGGSSFDGSSGSSGVTGSGRIVGGVLDR